VGEEIAQSCLHDEAPPPTHPVVVGESAGDVQEIDRREPRAELSLSRWRLIDRDIDRFEAVRFAGYRIHADRRPAKEAGLVQCPLATLDVATDEEAARPEHEGVSDRLCADVRIAGDDDRVNDGPGAWVDGDGDRTGPRRHPPGRGRGQGGRIGRWLPDDRQ
jgi:hypothetical protein